MRLLRLLYTVPLRFRSLFRRNQTEQDLEDEFRDHLERRIEAGVANGMSPEEARYAALRAFGGIDQRKEVIAGINVVSLLLARTENRAREIAVRQALGASSVRLVTQFATEAVVLVAAAALFGLVLARWGMQLLSSLLSAEMISRMPYLSYIPARRAASVNPIEVLRAE